MIENKCPECRGYQWIVLGVDLDRRVVRWQECKRCHPDTFCALFLLEYDEPLDCDIYTWLNGGESYDDID
jgi:hypothetical protein